MQDSQDHGVLYQQTWRGMNMLDPSDTQYFELINGWLRSGYPETRPGMRRYLRMVNKFYFNEDDARVNDATHTGFWFDFQFVGVGLSNPIQGLTVVVLERYDFAQKIMLATDGKVYVYQNGFMERIQCAEDPAASETIEFVQANGKVYMLRGLGNAPLVWDGGSAGFEYVPAAAGGADNMPAADTGVWHGGGRLWLLSGEDLYASDVLDPEAYALVDAYWSVGRGGNDLITTLYAHHDDSILVFRERSIGAVTNVSAVVNPDDGEYLSDFATLKVVDNEVGCVARRAIVTVGEDVWFLGQNGIYSLTRNEQNRIERQAVPVSAPIEPWIRRINWNAVSGACAAAYNNVVMFAVPVDGSTENNAVLVYDLTAPGTSTGAWVSVWRGDMLRPVRFFEHDGNMIFVGADYVVRKMFEEHSSDSLNPMEDAREYSDTLQYEPGDVCKYEVLGEQILKRALRTMSSVSPADATAWETVSENTTAADVALQFITRWFDALGQMPLRWGRSEVVLDGHNVTYSLWYEGRNPGSRKVVCEDVTWSRTQYLTAGVSEWTESNAALDWGTRGRQDYSLAIGTDGMYVGADGVYAGMYTTGQRAFIPMSRERGLRYHVHVDHGRARIRSVTSQSRGLRVASGHQHVA